MSLLAGRVPLAGPSAFFVAATPSDSTPFKPTNSNSNQLSTASPISTASPTSPATCASCISSLSSSSVSAPFLSSSSYPASPLSAPKETHAMASTSTTSMDMRSPSTAVLQRWHRAAMGSMAAWGAALAAQTTVALRLLLSLLILLVLLQSVLQSLLRVLVAIFWRVWEWPSTRRLRKKLFFELAVAVLGPSGNSVILLVLWPGWFVLAPALWVLKICAMG